MKEIRKKIVVVVPNYLPDGSIALVSEKIASCLGVGIVKMSHLFYKNRDVEVVIYHNNPVVDKNDEHLRYIKQLAKNYKFVYYVTTENKIGEKEMEVIDMATEVVAVSEYANKLIQLKSKRIIPIYVSDIFFKMKKFADVFDIAFLAKIFHHSVYRKGVDIFSHIVRNTGFRAITSKSVAEIVGGVSYYSSYEDIPYVLASSRFLLFPSRSEGFGIPPLEAMAVGTVPICSDAPAHNEHCLVKVPTRYVGYVTVDENEGIVVESYDSCWKDYVETIYDILTSEGKYEKLVEEGRKIVQNYRREVVCQMWRDYVEQIL